MLEENQEFKKKQIAFYTYNSHLPNCLHENTNTANKFRSVHNT
jgi:hypothetical protein